MGNVLHAAKSTTRKLWAADSFEGFPDEDKKGHVDAKEQVASADANAEVTKAHDVNGAAPAVINGTKGEFAAARKHFEANLALNKLNDGTVKILQGWFKDTLPTAGIKNISFLRLDGDLYVSTWDS